MSPTATANEDPTVAAIKRAATAFLPRTPPERMTVTRAGGLQL